MGKHMFTYRDEKLRLERKQGNKTSWRWRDLRSSSHWPRFQWSLQHSSSSSASPLRHYYRSVEVFSHMSINVVVRFRAILYCTDVLYRDTAGLKHQVRRKNDGYSPNHTSKRVFRGQKFILKSMISGRLWSVKKVRLPASIRIKIQRAPLFLLKFSRLFFFL